MAGGSGMRFGSKSPKQFQELQGKPVLLHTLEAFYRYSDKIEVVLVLPENELAIWETICREHNFQKPLNVQAGGSSRFQSVKKGLERIGEDGYVAIHDGVRPLVSTELIIASFKLAKVRQTAVAAVNLKDSIRMVQTSLDVTNKSFSSESRRLDRSHYRLIQTPQTFQVALIKKAYTLSEDPTFTDDASVAEAAGHTIHLFQGSYDNIKITTAEDLIIAETLLGYGRNSMK